MKMKSTSLPTVTNKNIPIFLPAESVQLGQALPKLLIILKMMLVTIFQSVKRQQKRTLNSLLVYFKKDGRYSNGQAVSGIWKTSPRPWCVASSSTTWLLRSVVGYTPPLKILYLEQVFRKDTQTLKFPTHLWDTLIAQLLCVIALNIQSSWRISRSQCVWQRDLMYERYV